MGETSSLLVIDRPDGKSQQLTLLAPKLYIPQLPLHLLPRPRLSAQLDEATHGRLTLLSAPAGFGKTTLLSAWAAHSAVPVAWVSLDNGDNDSTRFWDYVGTALSALHSEIATEISFASLAESAEAALMTLINAIVLTPRDVVLVLDDYQVITSSQIHHALTFLLDHMPPRLHLVIASRSDPPLPLSLLRARSHVSELRADDLCFTSDETATFFNTVLRLDLDRDELSTLDGRIEGWAAGLHLAALALRSQERDAEGHRHPPLAQLLDGHRYFVDYLIEEVFQRQPAYIQTFLLQTSILDRMSGPLCDAVLDLQPAERSMTYAIENGRQATLYSVRSREILEDLERANMFLVPLDERRRWYRYHHLFANVLREHLRQSDPEIIPALHRRAAAWYEEQARSEAMPAVVEAVKHALAAAEWTWAARLIEQNARTMLMRGEVATLLVWLKTLPDALVRVQPQLGLNYAWALLFSGHAEAATQHLDQVEQTLLARTTPAQHSTDAVSQQSNVLQDHELLGEMTTLRAFVALVRGSLARAVELAQAASLYTLESDTFLRSVIAMSRGLPAALDNNSALAAQTLVEAVKVGRATGNHLVVLMATSTLADLWLREGKFHQAAGLYHEALDLATDQDGQLPPIAGSAYIGLGELLYEWNDLEAAARALLDGIKLSQQVGSMRTFDGYLALSRVRLAQGDLFEAQDTIVKAEQWARKLDSTYLAHAQIGAHRARIWLAQSNLSLADSWAQSQGTSDLADEGLCFSSMYAFDQLVLAQVHLALGRHEQALHILVPLREKAEQSNRLWDLTRVLVLEALALRTGGDRAAAFASLSRALTLAHAPKALRVFVDAGPAMRALLMEVRSQPEGRVSLDEIERVLALFGSQTPLGEQAVPLLIPPPPELPIAQGTAPTFDGLSERELAVLRLIAAGKSTPEIAQTFVVAPSTVKTHIKNIYTKLDVHNRVEAASRARELHLLK